MKEKLAVLAALMMVCYTPLQAQTHEPQSKDRQAPSSSVVRIPTTEIFDDGQANDVQLRGVYPTVWFNPVGNTQYWNSCFIEMNMNEALNAEGRYFAFIINSAGDPAKQFLFNTSVLVKEPTATGSAKLQLKAGDGTTSSKNAYTQYLSNDATAASWSTGMLGDGQYRIHDDKTGADRMTIGVPDANNNVTITFNGTVEGGVIHAKYQDVAEWVQATQPMDAGTVVVLNPNGINQVMPSATAYDTSVAGVVSEQPGLLLGHPGDSKVRVATTGRVRVNVDASHAPIRVGDLLVTSQTPGTAARSEPIDIAPSIKIHRPGTILGKALEPLATGKGQILVLLTLQ